MGQQKKAKANKKKGKGRRTSTPNDGADEPVAAEIASSVTHEMTAAADASEGTSRTAASAVQQPDESEDNTADTGVINKLDNLDEAINWLVQPGQKIDFKRLSKYLPHTVEDLRSGSVDPPTLVQMLIDIATAFENVEDLAPKLANEIVSRRAEALNREFSGCIKDKMRRGLEARFRKPYGDNWGHFFIEVVKTAFDEACNAWKKRIAAKLFRGSLVAFRTSSPLFKFGPFEHFMVTNRHEREDADAWALSLYKALTSATQVASECLDVVKVTCWECGQLESTNVCDRCEVAIYCGRDCQVKAWKDGHKNACGKLKLTNEGFVTSMAAVDAAHDEGRGMIHGIPLAESFDYNMLTVMIMKHIDFQDIFGFTDEEVNRPSMANFYENLGRVVRGEWWVCANASTGPEYQRATQGAAIGHDQEYFRELGALLCYKYSTHTAARRIVQWSNGWCGVKMPASRFLEIYKDHVGLTEDRSKLKSAVRKIVLKTLREKFHKA